MDLKKDLDNFENLGAETTGIIHSTESFGAADGPGVRFIVFVRGCRMRCAYCHNPDTWTTDGGEKVTAGDIIKKALRYKSYWGADGGITVSGGEPLLQLPFVTALFKLAKENGIHTTLDTAGNPFTREEPFISGFNELMKYTDLVMLDIKEINNERHKTLTGFDNTNILDMARYLSDMGKPMWIRHVLVPDTTDFDEDLDKLGDFIKKLSTVQKVEVLPYHTLGRFKWDELGVKYRLEGVNPPDKERIKNAQNKICVLD